LDRRVGSFREISGTRGKLSLFVPFNTDGRKIRCATVYTLVMRLRIYISIGILLSWCMSQAQIKGIPSHIVPFAADSYENAKPWVVWYFMHASYSKEGITADLKAMAEHNIAGAYFTPIKAQTDPPLFDPPRETLTPEWWEMFRHLVAEAKKYGIQIAMFPNDG